MPCECAVKRLKALTMHKNAHHADTWHRRVRMHTRCTGSALNVHVGCAQNARRSRSLRPLLRRVIAPPRLGVVFIAVLLEDHEQVVDVVLLLVYGVTYSRGWFQPSMILGDDT